MVFCRAASPCSRRRSDSLCLFRLPASWRVLSASGLYGARTAGRSGAPSVAAPCGDAFGGADRLPAPDSADGGGAVRRYHDVPADTANRTTATNPRITSFCTVILLDSDLAARLLRRP